MPIAGSNKTDYQREYMKQRRQPTGSRRKRQTKSDVTDSHPLFIHLSKDCILSWDQAIKSLRAANNAHYNYKPLTKLSNKERKQMIQRLQNVNTKPTHEELNNSWV